jgi:hypothetical protein
VHETQPLVSGSAVVLGNHFAGELPQCAQAFHGDTQLMNVFFGQQSAAISKRAKRTIVELKRSVDHEVGEILRPECHIARRAK